MPRIVKEEIYTARRNEILDAAQRLVYTRGYEQMSIQDILDELQISKGAFYHYFGSKQAMLEALIERTQTEAETLVFPILQDVGLSAIEKLQRFFATAAYWKSTRKDFFLGLLRIWYIDENALVREKIFRMAVKRYGPLLTEVIRQGIGEGVFTTPYPDQMGEVVICLLQSMGNALSEFLLAYEPGVSDLCIENIVASYSDALERALGAPAGTLRVVDAAKMQEWVEVLK